MGNHRFKLSDMMPNAWFYKLRDMSKVPMIKKSMQQQQQQQLYYSSSPTTKSSLYYTTDPIRMDDNLCISPKFSSNKRSKRYTPSPTKIIPPRAHRVTSGFHQSNFIIKDFDIISEPDLPPIQTKPAGKHRLVNIVHDVSLHQEADYSSIISNNNTKRDRGGRKSFSGGVKIGRKPGRRRKASHVKEEEEKKKEGMVYSHESLAIVKASFDPEKDFRESMMEMIVENEIKAPKDLEDLLASYLSLNSLQYHHLIIKAFEQIWNQLHLHT